MKNPLFHFLETMTPKVRNAFQIGMAIAAAHFIALPYYLYLILSLGMVRFSLLTVVTLALAIVTTIGAIISWRGHPTTGMIVVLVILAISYPPISAFMASGLGTVLGIALLFVGPMSAFQVLPRKTAWIMSVITVASGLATLVLDMFNPITRPALPGIYIQLLATAVVIALVSLIVRQFRNYPMGTKLVVSFVAVAILSVATISFITYRITSTQITERIGKNLTAAAEGTALEIASSLDDAINTLQVLAMNKFLQDTLQTASTNDTSNQSAFAQLDEQWSKASDSSPLIQGVLNNGLASELRKFQKKFPNYAEVFVTDKYGAIVASTNRTSDYYQADEEWWQTAWNNGKGNAYIGQPEFDKSSNTMAINMALPVSNPNSTELVGVLRVTLNIASLIKVADAVDAGKTGHADLIFRDQTYKSGELGLTPVDSKEMNKITPLLGSYGEINFEGVPSLVTFVSIKPHISEHQNTIDQLGWFVTVHQSIAEAREPVITTTRTLILIALILIIIVALAALGTARFLSGPIVRLTAVAEQIAAGDINAQAKVETVDETGTLAKTFNLMTGRLRETLLGLEQRVAARTRNLELATEVGRAVSQVRELNVMLKNACELILKEFDLYYVQVYLTNPSQSTLKLEAGTGTVGAQLLERGHSLPFNSNSINGRAAVDQRSVVIADTSQSTTFRKNPLLPETRGEMAVPLIVADKVVGVLDMQSSKANVLTKEVLPAFEALSGQLAVAIQNANLLAETEQARAESEKQARRLVRTAWNEHLDAIHEPEQVGFLFDHNEVITLTDTIESQLPEDEKAVYAPISIAGETLGSLVVELDDESQRDQTNELVTLVARQMAQQIESLRLLDSAERYRMEAEKAARLTTMEGWKNYIESRPKDMIGYIYDTKEVKPLDKELESSALALPIKVHDETVGKFSVQEIESLDDQSLNIAQAVIENLGSHIENLRLLEETQRGQIELNKRAQREQTLRQITSALRGSTNPETIMRTAVRELGSILGRRTIVQMMSPEPSTQTGTDTNGNGSSPTVNSLESA